MVSKSWPKVCQGQLLANYLSTFGLGLTILAVSQSGATFFKYPGSFTKRSDLKKSLRSGPQGPLGHLGPLKSRFAPGSMPGITSRLDSQRNFGQFSFGHVEFRCFPSHFVPIFMFFINPEVGDLFLCP